jgi:hypothetical protein
MLAETAAQFLDRRSDVLALARESIEFGTAAMREVTAARSLPELFAAQLRCGRAAYEIWMRQVRLATALVVGGLR